MLLDKLRLRLTTEYGAFRQYLATAPLTAMDLINKSYEIVCKEQITELFNVMTNNDESYSNELITWILSKDNSLDFLFSVWKHTDYLIVSEFADLLHDELVVRKGGLNE